MKKWIDFLSEDPSKEHVERVKNAAASELELNRSQNPISRRFFTWRMTGALGLLTVAAFGVYQTLRDGFGAYQHYAERSAEQSEIALAFVEFSHPGDLELVGDLELINDLDNLEEWNGVDV